MYAKVTLLVVGLLLSNGALASSAVPEIDGAGLAIGIALLGASIALIKDRARRKGE
jgi:hypothetical protein